MRCFKAYGIDSTCKVLVPPDTRVVIERTGRDTFEWSVDGVKKGGIVLLPHDTMEIKLPVIELGDQVEIRRR